MYLCVCPDNGYNVVDNGEVNRGEIKLRNDFKEAYGQGLTVKPWP